MARVFSFLAYSVLAISSYSVANASIFVGGGLGIADGLVLEGGYKLNPFISIRGRGTYLPKTNINSIVTKFDNGFGNTTNNSGGTSSTTGNLESKSFDIGAEIRPVPFIPIVRGFTVIGSIQYLDISIDAQKSFFNQSIKIGGTTHSIANGYGAVSVTNKNKFAPYIGIGYDIINIPFISLRATLGATFRSFEVDNSSYNLPGVNQADFNKEVQKLNDKIGRTYIIPSLALTGRITI